MAVITISRQHGSGGTEIAARVCQLLGYRYFDKTLMAQVAAEVGLSDGEIADLSEDNHKVVGFLNRLLGGDSLHPFSLAEMWKDDFASARGEVKDFREDVTIPLVQSTITAAYRHGNVVILGRGGQALLREKPGVLHVRIDAPLGLRIQRVQAREGVRRETAQDILAQSDRAAADYLRRFYNIDGSDPLLYHLVINTGRWDKDAAAHLIIEAVNRLEEQQMPVALLSEA